MRCLNGNGWKSFYLYANVQSGNFVMKLPENSGKPRDFLAGCPVYAQRNFDKLKGFAGYRKKFETWRARPVRVEVELLSIKLLSDK